MERAQVDDLVKSGIYDGSPVNGKLIETHISWVILTKGWAFKIKKPIEYPFLDFSTLAKRKFYCQRELHLNKRLTDIYIDVLPIRHQEGFSIGGEKGKIVDYVVRMKKLQTSKKMDNMLEHNRVKTDQITRLAEKISDFHKKAQVIAVPFNLDQSKKNFNDILDISDWAQQTLDQKHHTIIHEAVTFSNSFLDMNANRMEQRVQDGFKRDVHGDLHSKNIFLYRDPIIFDCIEFNDHYRQIDLLNEVAFFCMDLEAFGKWGLSSTFMKKYTSVIPCIDSNGDEQLFIYYKFYRANVRAKVNALRAIQADPTSRDGFIKETVKYLDLMAVYQQRLTK